MPIIGHTLSLAAISGTGLDNTLHYNYLLDSGSTIANSVLKGPIPTFTRATAGWAMDSSGNFTEVAIDTPRFAHDPFENDAQLGLLIEEARTNLALQSSTFGTTWSSGALNVDIPTTNNSDIFGTTTADEIATTNTADEAYAIFQDFTGLTANTVTSCSVYVKTGTTVSFVQLAWDDGGGGADGLFCNFQLTGSGTVGTVTALAAGGDTLGASITRTKGDDEAFYRCTLTGEIDIGTTGRFTISMVDRIDAAVFEAADLQDNDSIIVCAAQIEVGAFPTSHIPTTTISVTRAKESFGTDDVDWLDMANGTLFAQVITGTTANAGASVSRQIVNIDNNVNDNEIVILAQHSDGVDWFLRIRSSSADQFISQTGTPTVGSVQKLAAAWTTNDGEFVEDGVSLATDSSITTPTGLTHLSIGEDHIEANQFNGYIQTLKYYNVRKPNDFLVTETT